MLNIRDVFDIQEEILIGLRNLYSGKMLALGIKIRSTNIKIVCKAIRATEIFKGSSWDRV